MIGHFWFWFQFDILFQFWPMFWLNIEPNTKFFVNLSYHLFFALIITNKSSFSWSVLVNHYQQFQINFGNTIFVHFFDSNFIKLDKILRKKKIFLCSKLFYEISLFVCLFVTMFVSMVWENQIQIAICSGWKKIAVLNFCFSNRLG